jgi:predicted metal-dependent TIM-barrel fold hydrolase
VKYIDPHIHMVSRTTDDYQRMAQCGCVAMTEPAFWAGYDRSSPQGFFDYFRQLTEYEPRRAALYGIDHYCWLCINSKEAEDPAFAREVVALIPDFLDRPNVLGVGEIGLNKNSRSEMQVLEEQIDLAARYNQLILVHTPHLEDKLKGTKLILDALKADSRIKPERVIIDHVEEHTVDLVLDAGFWAGITLYPESKVNAARAVDIIEHADAHRIWMNSACDWGHSVPLAVPRAATELRKRGHSAVAIDQLIFGNPQRFLGQNPRFKLG